MFNNQTNKNARNAYTLTHTPIYVWYHTRVLTSSPYQYCTYFHEERKPKFFLTKLSHNSSQIKGLAVENVSKDIINGNVLFPYSSNGEVLLCECEQSCPVCGSYKGHKLTSRWATHAGVTTVRASTH